MIWPTMILRLPSSAPSPERGAPLAFGPVGVDLCTNYSDKRLKDVIGLFGLKGLPSYQSLWPRGEL